MYIFLTNLIMLAKQNGIFPWLMTKDDNDFAVFLRLGSIEIRWYALFILAGAMFALYRCRHELKKRNMPEDFYDNFTLSVLPIAIVGARLWYVISEWDKKFASGDFMNVFKIWNGGLAVQGGVLFGVIWGCIYFTTIKKRYPLAFHFDLIVPTVLIGQIVGRIGNFFNGEVYGKLVERSSLWFVPKFAIDYCTGVGADSQVGQNMVHIPLFYIESMINIVGFILIGIVLWNFWKKGRKPFQVGSLYFIWYGVVRLLLEPLRDSSFIMGDSKFGTSMVMSIIYISIGVILFVVSEIIFFKMPFEKIYINEAAELIEKEKREAHDKELNLKIEAKKQEIRDRKAKEANNG